MAHDENRDEPRPRIRVKIAGLERIEPTGTSQVASDPIPLEEQSPTSDMVRYPYTYFAG